MKYWRKCRHVRCWRGGSMLLFCPTCGNVLIVEEGQKCLRFACNTCPYVHNINRKVTSRKYPKLKEVDDVLGGSAAWENVDSTAELRYIPKIQAQIIYVSAM
ncbi:DNA-directed RNA polymerase III subunit RPC10 [Phyllobates terribilis]|uniref:DNA-directed RNA polymerase III subunit RPC10 n=1 Tax=Phyllobates terribilis TaxID=111132 RepID=UPI003CCAD89D